MNEETFQKLEELLQAGKITKEQKDLLEQALLQNKQADPPRLEITSVLDTENKELNIKLMDEDVKVSSDKEATQVNIIKGSDLVEIIKTDSKILIQSKKENMNFFGISFRQREEERIVIIVPESMQIKIKTVSGDIKVQDTNKAINIKSVSGDIYIENQKGNTYINCISGDIEMDKVEGLVEITSKSGDIEIQNSKIQGIMKTYSGDIHLDKNAIDNVEISVFSGDIEMDKILGSGLLQLKSFSGDIHAAFRNQTGFIKGITSSGEILVKTEGENQISLDSQEYGDPSDPLQIQIKTMSGDGKIRFTNQ